jgi:NADP-dependent aldehyde dehydrogenase
VSGGRALFDLANSRAEPIPVFAEMGSVNPIVVMPSVLSLDPQNVSDKIAFAVTNDAGQFCTKPGVVFIQVDDALEDFKNELVKKIRAVEPRVMLSSSMLSAFESGLNTVFDSANTDLEQKISVPFGTAVSAVLEIDQDQFLGDEDFHQELFGPFTLIVRYADGFGLQRCLDQLQGQLTCSIFGSLEDLKHHKELLRQLQQNAGRVIVNGMPTGVTVCGSMQHGGPFPASTDSRFSAVGSDAILRFMRPVSFQNYPQELLPELLQDENPLSLYRRINGRLSQEEVVHKKD